MNLVKVLENIPILPLYRTVLFPHMIIPLKILEPANKALIQFVMAQHRFVIVSRIRDEENESEDQEIRMHRYGSVGYVSNVKITSSGEFLVTIRGLARVLIIEELSRTPYMTGRAELIIDKQYVSSKSLLAEQYERLWSIFQDTVRYLPDHGYRLNIMIRKEFAPWSVCNLIGAYLLHNVVHKQQLLEIIDPHDRVTYLTNLLIEYKNLAKFYRCGSTDTPGTPWLN